MRKIVLFCEDSGHERFIKALIYRMLPANSATVKTLSARRGRGKTLSELERYLKQEEHRRLHQPDAIVAAIDANCKGYNEKKREIDEKIPLLIKSSIPVIHAIPDPHIERWMLIDSHAFKKVFGAGCSAPTNKCEKGLYKKILADSITQAGGNTLLGGMEYSQDIVENMDINRIQNLDESLKKFAEELLKLRNRWKTDDLCNKK